MLRAFFHDPSSHRDVNEFLSAYVASPQDFVRWWDPTIPPGEVITFYNGLPEHLEKLQRDGIDLTVTGFRDVGFQGRGTSAGGWFNFGVRGRLQKSQAMGGGETLRNKGAIDCATRKLNVIVL